MKTLILPIGLVLIATQPVRGQTLARCWDNIMSQQYHVNTGASTLLTFDGQSMPSATVLGTNAQYYQAVPVSDPLTGELIFTLTSNGIYDANWQLTPNSDIWNGGGGGRLVVPHPGDRNKFYLIGGNCSSGYCYEYHWTIFDRTLNGGLGDIDPEEVAQPWATAGISNPNFNAMISSADGNTYWFVTHAKGSADWTLYPITRDEGINAVPITRTFGPVINDSTHMWMAVPPTNDKVLIRYRTGIGFEASQELLVFDNEIGDFTGWLEELPFYAPENNNSAFSPSGRYFYRQGGNDLGQTVLNQWDLEAGDGQAIANSLQQIVIPPIIQGAYLELFTAPDGRIWLGGQGDSQYLTSHIVPVHAPNEPGDACQIGTAGVYLGDEFIAAFGFRELWWPVLADDVGQVEVTGSIGLVLSAWPNPARERVTLQMSGLEQELMEVVLRDGLGRVVRQAPWRDGAGPLELDVRDLASGLYSVVAYDREKALATTRFFKE